LLKLINAVVVIVLDCTQSDSQGRVWLLEDPGAQLA